MTGRFFGKWTWLAWVVIATSVLLLAFNLSTLRPAMTNDGPSYMVTALEYRLSGTLPFPEHREPGYRVFLLGLSLLVPWQTEAELLNWIAVTQLGLYLLLAALLAVRLARLVGPWGAALTVLVFAANRFDAQWLVTPQSEAVSKLALLLALWMVLGRSRWRWGMAAAVLGVVPILRPSDIAVPAAALAATAVWMLLAWRRRQTSPLPGALAIAVLLVGPTVLYSVGHGLATGFTGLSERSGPAIASRVFASTDPEWLAERGMDRAFLDEVAAPLWRDFSGKVQDRIFLTDDLQQPSDLSFRACPYPRLVVLNYADAYLKRRDLPSDPYARAAILQQQGNRALAKLPPQFIACTADVMWDYLRLPVVRAATSHSLRNKLTLVLPLVLFGSLAAVWFRRPVGSATAVLAVTAATAGPLYVVVCGLFNNYMERLATHLWLPMALCALAAAALQISGSGDRRRLRCPPP